MRRGTVLIATPAYRSSPGTRQRVLLLALTLLLNNYRVYLASMDAGGSRGSSIRRAYYVLGDLVLGSRLLSHLYGFLGYLAYRGYRLSTPADVEIFVMDVLAPIAGLAARARRSLVIASIEDLTPTYLAGLRGVARGNISGMLEGYLDSLCTHLERVDVAVAPSHTLASLLSRACRLDVRTIPVGVDPRLERWCRLPAALEERRRKLEEGAVELLVAGQLHSPREAVAAARLAGMLRGSGGYKLRLLVFGRGVWNRVLAEALRRRRVVDTIVYNYPDAGSAARRHCGAHLGIVVAARPAFTLTRIYYHMGLAQPVILYDAYGLVRREASSLETVYEDVTRAVDGGDSRGVSRVVERMLAGYAAKAEAQRRAAEKLLVPQVHRELIELLQSTLGEP